MRNRATNIKILSPQRQLLESCLKGDSDKVETLLKTHLKDQAIDLEICDTQGNSALTLAIRYKHLGIVQQLIKARADVNNQEGYTPLYTAVKTKNRVAIDLLLDAKANINLTCYNKSPLTCILFDYATTLERSNIHIDDKNLLKLEKYKIIFQLIGNGAQVNLNTWYSLINEKNFNLKRDKRLPNIDGCEYPLILALGLCSTLEYKPEWEPLYLDLHKLLLQHNDGFHDYLKSLTGGNFRLDSSYFLFHTGESAHQKIETYFNAIHAAFCETINVHDQDDTTIIIPTERNQTNNLKQFLSNENFIKMFISRNHVLNSTQRTTHAVERAIDNDFESLANTFGLFGIAAISATVAAAAANAVNKLR